MERMVVYAVIAVVFMSFSKCVAVDFEYEAENPTFFTPGQVGFIIDSLIDFYRRATRGYSSFPTGVSLPAQEIIVNGITVTMRIYIYNAAAKTCSANPGFGSIPSSDIVEACNQIVRGMSEQAHLWGSHFVNGVAGVVSLQYFTNSRRAKGPQMAPELLWDANDCWVYRSTLENGGSPHAVMYPNSALVSPSGRFMFYLSYVCNMYLLDLTDDTKTPRWTSNTRASNCILVMQLDVNLVLYHEDGSVLWATNEYCISTTCVVNAVFVVQDDGNAVVYESDTRTAVWATQTN